MGYPSYSLEDRSVRASTAGYHTKSVNEIFTQNVERKMHNTMNPNGVVIRECRDSAQHPDATPIQLYLDVTGSMGRIPHDLIKDGLPTLMGKLIQNGVPDAALMFGAIGDHECDRCPLQIGQFESGDAELDMWLTRTYIESGGGGNSGESYALAYYFAANHVKTDAFEKRNKKGFVFTIGDEPCLPHYPQTAIKHIMGNSALGQGNNTKEELLAAAQKQNHVFHIFIEHSDRRCGSDWKQMLGDNLIVVSNYDEVSNVISETILKQLKIDGGTAKKSKQKIGSSQEEEPKKDKPAKPTIL